MTSVLCVSLVNINKRNNAGVRNLTNVRDIQQHSTTIPSFGKNKNNITINSLQSSIIDNTLESSSGSLIFTSTNDSENYFTTSTSNTTITSSSINNIIEKDSLLPNPFITTVTTDNSNINYNPQIESQELVIVSDNDLAIITTTESQLESVEVTNSQNINQDKGKESGIQIIESQLFESLAIATSKMTFIKVEPESDDEITTPATHGHFLRKRTKRISYPKDYPSNSTGNRRSKARKLRQKNKHRQTLQQSVNENDADDDENAQLVRHDLRSRKVLDKQSNKQISDREWRPDSESDPEILSDQGSTAGPKSTLKTQTRTTSTTTSKSVTAKQSTPSVNLRPSNPIRTPRNNNSATTTTTSSKTRKSSLPSKGTQKANQLSKDNGGTKRGTRVKRKEIVNKELSGVDNNDIEKIEIEQQFSITSDTNTMELVDAEAYDSPEASLPKPPTTTRKTSTSSPERLIKSRRRSTVVINELDNNEFEEEKETIPVESSQDNVTPKKSRMAATKKSSNKGVRSRRGGKTKGNINTTTEVAVIPNKETQIEQTTSSPSQSDYDDYDVVKISAENPNALTNVIKSVRRGRGGKTKGNIDSTTEVAVIPNNETQIEQTTPSSSQSDYDDPDVVKISAENPDALAGAIRALTFQNYDIVHTSANIIPIIQPQTTSIPRSIRVKPSPSSSLSSSPPSTIKSNRPKTSPSPNVNSSAWDDNHWRILKYTYLEIRNNYIEKGKSGIHNEDVYKEVIKSFLNIRPQFEESEIRVRMIALETVEIEKQGKRNTERRGSIESSSSKNSRFSATRYNSAYSNMRNTHNNPRKRKKIVKADLTEDDDLDDNSEVMAEGSKRRRGLDSDSISDVNTTGQNTPPRAKFSSLFGWFGKRTTDNASQISASDIAVEQNEKYEQSSKSLLSWLRLN
nr:7410_t:CDS:10 [Entrophospora candida]